MRKFSLSLISLMLGMALVPAVQGAQSSAKAQLLDQVRMGEANKRDDLVRQSLQRLEMIAPDDPDVMAARVRYLLRQGDNDGAQKLMAKMGKQSPEAPAVQSAKTSMALSTAEGRAALQEARLMAASGRTDEAIAAYNKLFNGQPPSADLEGEYWLLMAKKPASHKAAVDRLMAMNARTPNGDVGGALAKMLFDDGRMEDGYTVLRQMSRSNAGRGTASSMWYARIKDMAPGQASIAALQRYLTVFSDGDDVAAARQQLAQQQIALSNTGRPAATATASTAQTTATAVPPRIGTATAPTNTRPAATAPSATPAAMETETASAPSAPSQPASAGQLAGARGENYSRQGNRAMAVQELQRALSLEPDGDGSSKWKSLLQTNRYWLLIEQGDNALKANNTADARQRYQQARRVDGTDSYAVLGLGDVAVAEKDDASAERFYQQALRMDAGNSNAVRGLANIYRRESPARATAFIQSLNKSQRNSIDDIERGLRDDQLEKQAAELENQGQWAQAAVVQQRRLDQDPDSVWITYRLAKDLAASGQQAKADALFQNLARKIPTDPDQVYARGLYLAGTDRDAQALTAVNALPRAQWTDNIKELADRLEFNNVMIEANRLRDGGHEDQAIALLNRQTPSDRIDLTLADWADERGDQTTAIAQYNKVLAHDPQNSDARLGLTESYLSSGNKDAARQQLTAYNQIDGGEKPSIGTTRRIANANAALGDDAKARQMFNGLIAEAKAMPPSQDSALALRDASRYQAASGDPQAALRTWGDTMVASGITDKPPVDNDTFTRLTRNDEKDDWLKRGVRSDAADLYRQQDVNVTLDHDYWGSSGTPGYSDLQAHTTMLQVDAPLSDGRMFFRTDMVNMDPGSFGDERYPSWGSCHDAGCSNYGSQRASGASLAVGWKNDTWAGDIGTTPLGFDVVDVVGGLSYSNDLGPIGYTVNMHRRPISSSVLSFAGQRDPNTNTTWGGVRATGGGVSLSYDKGEANGVWSSLGADSITGKNVADNWRARWMTGYYYKLVNENNRRVTVGVTNMLWHYDKDLSGYTLGQGGYYSPQQYVSFALPIIWRQRTENWSWELGGSVSWSHSKSNDVARYPLQNLIPDEPQYTDRNAIEEGSSSNGVGYTVRALVERRITSHWSIGAGIDIQQAKDYTPSHALIFARYSLGGWQGDMNMPPEPLVPYADW